MTDAKLIYKTAWARKPRRCQRLFRSTKGHVRIRAFRETTTSTCGKDAFIAAFWTQYRRGCPSDRMLHLCCEHALEFALRHSLATVIETDTTAGDLVEQIQNAGYVNVSDMPTDLLREVMRKDAYFDLKQGQLIDMKESIQ